MSLFLKKPEPDKGPPRYPYTFLRTFFCGHPHEKIEVNLDSKGEIQHTLLTTLEEDLSQWNEVDILRFSLQRCHACAAEHKIKRQITHKNDVRALEASQGEAMKERHQRRNELKEALHPSRHGDLYRAKQRYGGVPYHSRLNENDYRNEDQTVIGPGGQSYKRATRGTEEDFADSARVARFEERKAQEERDQLEEQERRELREEQRRLEELEEREREQLYQQQKVINFREQARSLVPEQTDSKATMRNSGGTKRTDSRTTMRNSAGTDKSSEKEENGKPKGVRGFMKKKFSKVTRRSSEGSRGGSAGSVRSPRETPRNSSGLATTPSGGGSRESANSARSPRETPAPKSSWGIEAGDSRGATARSSAGATRNGPLETPRNASGTVAMTAARPSKESESDSPEEEYEKYQAMRDIYDGKAQF